jgi:hypothetical protein
VQYLERSRRYVVAAPFLLGIRFPFHLVERDRAVRRRTMLNRSKPYLVFYAQALSDYAGDSAIIMLFIPRCDRKENLTHL